MPICVRVHTFKVETYPPIVAHDRCQTRPCDVFWKGGEGGEGGGGELERALPAIIATVVVKERKADACRSSDPLFHKR